MSHTVANEVEDLVIYKVGIDVGLNSVGVAAVQVDKDGTPLKILNAQSFIHDGGIDPTGNKTKETRLKVSGVARRVRRLYGRRRKRLQQLDNWLKLHGYPIINLESYSDPRQVWFIRDELASGYIANETERIEKISVALRHIARHRGWRSPYQRIESLIQEESRSENFSNFRERCEQLIGEPIPEALTVGQIVARLGRDDQTKLRFGLRNGAKSRREEASGLFGGKLEQRDNLHELRVIAAAQGVSDDELNTWVSLVFKAKSPLGSHVERVGYDPLDPKHRRASKASLVFQQFRIAAVLANVRVIDMVSGARRRLSLEERSEISDFLRSATSGSVSWADVADVIGVDKNQIVGAGKTDATDDEPVSAHPPVMQTNIAIMNSKIKPLVSWWKKADEADKESFILTLVDGHEIDGELSDLFSKLDESDLAKLDSFNLPSGRAAYSTPTLRRLTNRILAEEIDLSEARMTEFNLPAGWNPPAPAIFEQIGNPAVDRVLKIINRWLMAAARKWGSPASINVEHVREGFVSNALAEEFTRQLNKRKNVNEKIRQEIRDLRGESVKIRSVDLMRMRAIKRQSGQCLYCGANITFNTAEMDHIVPRKGLGSTSTMDNLVASCIECNRSKSNQLFRDWAERSKRPGVSLAEALERVDFWNDDPAYMSAKETRKYKAAVKARLKRKHSDPEFDGRSLESVAWMARELRRRILHALPNTKVALYQGRLTAEARKCSGFEKRVQLIGGATKTRFDRRHHAIDALVISMMRQSVATTLAIRMNMRRAQEISPHTEDDHGMQWKQYEGRTEGDRLIFHQWRHNMDRLLALANEALAADEVLVRFPLRARLSNSSVHKDTVNPLDHSLRTQDKLSVSQIDRSATPGQWVALRRCPDFDEKNGLPENPQRRININGTKFGPADNLEFFPDDKARIKVRGGCAAVGNSIHHYRIYKILGSKPKLAFVRVYGADLQKHQHSDLFSVSLPPQSLSRRYASASVCKALNEGKAEQVGVLMPNDEVEIDLSAVSDEGLRSLIPLIGAVSKWRVAGAESNRCINFKPLYLSSEGLEKIVWDGVADLDKLVAGSGSRVSFSTISSAVRAVIRRDVMGIPITSTKQGMLHTFDFEN